jgi:DNA-binding MarR family transcriptional regulator
MGDFRPLLPESFAGRAVCVTTRLGQTLNRLIELRLEPLHLKLRHYTVLHTLAAEGVMSQHELGELLTMDPATTAITLEELEQRRLVARKREPENRRKYAVDLTARGRGTLARAELALERLEAEVLVELSHGDQTQLRRLLDVLAFGEEYPALARAEGAVGGRRRG